MKIDLKKKAVIKSWLIDYAWCQETLAEKEAIVECILSQDDWKYLAEMSEKYMSQAAGEDHEAELFMADGFALSSLYECHDGPHLPTCPER